jgi:predicted RND superfamily exporter protein
MWDAITRLILRNRIIIIIILVLLTLFMGYEGLKVKISYDFPQLLSDKDKTVIEYNNFKKLFGEDGSIIVIGTNDSSILKLENFNKWAYLTNKIKQIEGIDTVLSITNVYNVRKDTVNNTFVLEKLIKKNPENQAELDSLLKIIFSLPFYENLLYTYNGSEFSTLMAITLNKKILNTKSRSDIINEIELVAKKFSDETEIPVHFSGMPYLRTLMMRLILFELPLFIILAAILLSIIIFILFRSLKAVFISLLIVSISVIFVFGTLGLFNYSITILTGLIPALIIVIGIPNCIYFINRYHQEYTKINNKIKSISSVIKKIGSATFLTNSTTALGFATFILTDSKVLVQFGTIASLNVFFIFILSLFIIPIIFSFLKSPKPSQTKHLENKLLRKVTNKLIVLTLKHRNAIYITTVIIVILSVFGILFLRNSSSILDDYPHKNKGYADLLFFEKYYKGVLPIEIKIENKKGIGIFGENAKTLYKIKQLEKVIKRDSLLSKYLSKTLSMSDVVSFSYQAYHEGENRFYAVPALIELSKLQAYTKSFNEKQIRFKSFVDSSNTITRISIQMANIESHLIKQIKDTLMSHINYIFPKDEYNITVTGTSIVFLEGTTYLLYNLVVSIALAILIISFLVFLIFRSGNMIIIYLLPNIIPLLFTAGLMGYFNIPIKPSTILIFSVAYGIAVDNTIHFLAKYRQELKILNWSIKKSVAVALHEIGVSMIYNAIILFCGFAIFTASSFGGTKAMGILLSITLLFAAICNLTLLPALLLSFEKRIHAIAYKDPLIQIFDEEDDINTELLKISESQLIEDAEN